VPGSRIGSPQYRWYVAAQRVSLVGSSMSTAARYWLAFQVAHGNGLLLSVVVAAQLIPFLIFCRRAGSIVAARLLIVTQTLQLVASLAFAVPLFAEWMPSGTCARSPSSWPATQPSWASSRPVRSSWPRSPRAWASAGR
jgi:hypothetical protein